MGLGGVRENGEPGDVLEPDSGIRALGKSPAFEGPVEPTEAEHTCNDHLALFYETREEQLSAIVPFLRQGLARGERCMYVTDETGEDELREALRKGGIDVEGAVERGALVFETVDATYLRDGSFDPAEMMDFYERQIEAATDSFSALRVTAETTWLQRDEGSIEEFLAFEARTNARFEREDFVALCQYDRSALEPSVRKRVVQSHPHLISEGTLCQNVYYTPPPDYFGPGRAERHVDQMLGTLVERTETKATRHERQQVLAEVAEIIAQPGETVESTLRALFDRGCEWFDLDLGAVATVDPAKDRFEVEYCNEPDSRLEPGLELPLSETYCAAARDAGGVASVVDPPADGFGDVHMRDAFGFDTYYGTYVPIRGGPDRTFFFVGSRQSAEPISETERAVLELVGEWVKCAFERRSRERCLRESYAVTSNPELGFDEKLRRLLELGRKQFDLELGFFARRDDETETVEVVQSVGPNEPLAPAAVGHISEGVCRTVAESGGPVTVRDSREEFLPTAPSALTADLAACVGTTVCLGQEVAGSLCFCSRSGRSEPVSESSLTFLSLLSQWIEYELARRRREDRLGRLTELAADTERSFDGKLAALFELGCEQFDLDLGCVAAVDPEAGEVEIEAVSTDHQDLEPGARIPLTEGARQILAGRDGPADGSVAAEAVFEDVIAEAVDGTESSLGTRVELAHDCDRLLCFVTGEPSHGGFSVSDRTFHDLMGQWVSYELGREHRESQLAALNRMSRDLVDAETRAEIAERTAAHAAGDLQLPVTGIVTYDGESGELTAAALTDRAEEELPLSALDDRPNGPLWEAFVSGERRRITDLGEEGARGALTEVLAVPLGRQGLFVTATPAPGGFDQMGREFVETTAATVEAAYTRADREQQLHQREARLESQNDALERLNRVNDIIRNIDQALVGAGSRTEIETVVCEQLAEVGPYELAWIGDHDGVSETIRSKQVAGDGRAFIADATAESDEPTVGPIGRALERGEVQVVNDVVEHTDAEPWRQAALNRGFHACIALPLCYEESCYGVLVVCSDQPEVFEELERTVLAEMADTIAYGINAVESKKAIVSDEVTRLTFDIEDADLAPVTFARQLDYEVSLESLVPGSDGVFRAFVSTSGLNPAPVCQLSDELDVEDITLAAANEEPDDPFALYEITLSDSSPISTALEHGGRPCDLTITDEEATLTIEMAADAAVREFVDMFRSTYPGTELHAQRTLERPQRSPTEFYSAIVDALTDRQLEALQLAYHSGYLEEPRLQRATDLAETMGITQPTFNSHLRAAHRKLCEQLFDGQSPTA